MVGGWYTTATAVRLIMIIPVVHGRFAATATAAAAADRCSFSLISPVIVVAVVWLLLV